MSARAGESLESGARLRERYEIRRTLGHGGMGVVYEAFDGVRATRVALKTMRQISAADLYRLKREFRALADLSHPNLVALYELEADGALTFFTMELVEGVDFLRHVRAVDATDARERFHAGPGLDADRLRRALAQLVDGVAALHAGARLHRDLKPTNVFVTPEGRVVILDFGLAAQLRSDGRQSTDDGIVGTPEYMSPEQAASETLTEASDWYSVGVMLYEALTGALPFVGAPLTVLTSKQTIVPRPPRDVASGVPDDLDALCVELLAIDPSRRPKASEIRARLHAPVGSAIAAHGIASRPMTALEGAFVGRDRHMAMLTSAFDEACAGRAVVAYVHGRSGMGKSLLGQRAVSALTLRRPDAVVLAARCYERESVPYKALDGIVDALSEHLVRLSDAEVDAILPIELRALTRLFPVLHRVPSVSKAAQHQREIADLQELRRRAAEALRELLARLSSRRPLVLWIDDLQWADVDSAALIEAVLRPPHPPALLVLASYRSEDATSAFVTALRRVHGLGRDAPEAREIEVGVLEPEEARALAAALLEVGGASVEASAIASESRGSPFFVDALVEHARAGRARVTPTAGTPRLDDVIHEHVSALPDDARRLLEVVAIAAKPVALAVASTAAQLEGAREGAAMASLRTGKLVRSRGLEVATYHDRIRETVVARLDAEARARLHLTLAHALVASGGADAEALVVHFDEGGAPERGAEAAAVAAEKAVEALAFDRAARLWRRALDRPNLSAEASHRLRSKLADALTNDGRDAEAADVRLEIARHADTVEALDLRRRASEQLLLSGHFERGYALLRDVLTGVGERFPTSPIAVVFWVLVARLRLHLRGLAFHERPVDALDRLALVRIDSVGSAGAGFAMTDNIRGAYFQSKNLLLALDAGDVRRIARALALEVCFTSASGSKTRARTLELLAAAKRLGTRVATPEALALADLAAGYARFMNGEWRDAKSSFIAAEERFRDACIDVNWLLSSARTMLYRTLVQRGELGELAARIPPVLRSAVERADEYAVLNVRANPLTMVQLANDEPEAARDNLEELQARLPKGVFHVQHYYVLVATLELDLYVGRPLAGLERLRATRSALRRSLLLRVETVRIAALDQRARCAIAAATEASGTTKADLLKIAVRDASTIGRVDNAWATALALVLRAGVCALVDDRAGALAALARADDALTANDMFLRAAAVRRRRGQWIGGDEGAALVADAEASMARLGARNHEAMSRLYAPGFDRLLVPFANPGANVAA